jgi:hypothetical protein
MHVIGKRYAGNTKVLVPSGHGFRPQSRWLRVKPSHNLPARCPYPLGDPVLTQ